MTTATESTALVAPSDNEIDLIRQRGAKEVALRKEMVKLERQIAGLTWGSGNALVQGSSLSPMTRAALAEFCAITRANPMTDIDILGNRPYLNSNYWSGLINTHPLFHHYEQRDLSPSVEKALRERAARHRELAEQLSTAGKSAEAADRLARALDLEEEADDVALARAQWSPRDTATCVIQTAIVRFINAAPMEAIQRGEITDLEPYLIRVSECNWAGGMGQTMAQAKKWDPIGDANPGTTARTRSLRRAAVKSFSAWMQAYDRQIQKAEEAIEAEFEIIRSERHAERAQLPAPNGPQAVRIGAGEPSASATNGAKPLPVDAEPTSQPESERSVELRYQPRPGNGAQTAPTKDAAGEVSIVSQTDVTTSEIPLTALPFDLPLARRTFFANLTDAGIGHDEARKAWQKDNSLPASTREWTPGDWQRALELLVGPARKKFLEGCAILGHEPDQVEATVLERPAYRIRDYELCLGWVNAQVDAEEGA